MAGRDTAAALGRAGWVPAVGRDTAALGRAGLVPTVGRDTAALGRAGLVPAVGRDTAAGLGRAGWGAGLTLGFGAGFL